VPQHTGTALNNYHQKNNIYELASLSKHSRFSLENRRFTFLPMWFNLKIS